MTLEEIDRPEPGPGQVAIDVGAVGINFPDVLQIRGGYQVKPPLPFTPGGEIAGTIGALGEGVTGWSVGDRVLWMGGGGMSERVLAPAGSPFPLPDSMPFAKAAALLSNYGTTLFALRDRAHLQPGETLLVHAGAGGIGSSAVQIGKAMGATVYATAGGPEKKAIVAGLGADAAIDYLNEDFVEIVKDLTGGKGVDVIYDPVGGDTFDRSRKVIGWDGRFLIIGFTSGRIADCPTNHVLLKNYSLVGVHWGASIARNPSSLRATFDDLCGLWERGGIDPLIMRTVPMDEAPAALVALSSRASYGKLVIDPSA
jgi:NADPH2:quinone reductase